MILMIMLLLAFVLGMILFGMREVAIVERTGRYDHVPALVWT